MAFVWKSFKKKLRIEVGIETGVEQVAQGLTKTLPTFTCGDANIFTE